MQNGCQFLSLLPALASRVVWLFPSGPHLAITVLTRGRWILRRVRFSTLQKGRLKGDGME